MNYVLGGVFTLVALFIILGLAGSAASDSFEQKCLNYGRVVVNGSVYECKPVGKEVKP